MSKESNNKPLTSCSAHRLTDLDLAPIARTEGNYWKAQFFEASRELTKANKGIRRLKAKIARLTNGKDSVQLAEDLRQENPLAWLVFADPHKTEWKLCGTRAVAMSWSESFAEEYGTDDWPVYPLWAGSRRA